VQGWLSLKQTGGVKGNEQVGDFPSQSLGSLGGSCLRVGRDTSTGRQQRQGQAGGRFKEMSKERKYRAIGSCKVEINEISIVKRRNKWLESKCSDVSHPDNSE